MTIYNKFYIDRVYTIGHI